MNSSIHFKVSCTLLTILMNQLLDFLLVWGYIMFYDVIKQSSLAFILGFVLNVFFSWKCLTYFENYTVYIKHMCKRQGFFHYVKYFGWICPIMLKVQKGLPNITLKKCPLNISVPSDLIQMRFEYIRQTHQDFYLSNITFCHSASF